MVTQLGNCGAGFDLALRLSSLLGGYSWSAHLLLALASLKRLPPPPGTSTSFLSQMTPNARALNLLW